MGEVVTLTLTEPAQTSIVADLRDLADRIERGEFDSPRAGMVLIDMPDMILRENIGPSFALLEAVGILEAAKFAVLDQTFGE